MTQLRTYDQGMFQQSGGAASRQTVSLVCGVLALVAIMGGAAVALTGSVGDNCGSGLSAARTKNPRPLLTPAQEEEIKRTKQNPYEAALAIARPFQDCRDAGRSRLVIAGLISGLLLLVAGGVFTYVYLYGPRNN